MNEAIGGGIDHDLRDAELQMLKQDANAYNAQGLGRLGDAGYTCGAGIRTTAPPPPSQTATQSVLEILQHLRRTESNLDRLRERLYGPVPTAVNEALGKVAGEPPFTMLLDSANRLALQNANASEELGGQI